MEKYQPIKMADDRVKDKWAFAGLDESNPGAAMAVIAVFTDTNAPGHMQLNHFEFVCKK